MKDKQPTTFTIEADLGKGKKRIIIKPAETTDGEDYYCCELNGEDISQVRKDPTGWEQLWGDLSEDQVKKIGIQIDEHHDNL